MSEATSSRDFGRGKMGMLYAYSRPYAASLGGVYEYYASLADSFDFVERHQPSAGGAVGLLVREPVGVVGAIVPWNGPLPLMLYKTAPAFIAGCTVVLKASPEAPGEAYALAEIVDEIGLPPGVMNVVTADRGVSELLVSDPRVDKISFTGSTAAGRRIASIVSRHQHDNFVEALAASYSAMKVGDPFDPTVAVGPLASGRQLANVLSYIERGQADGAVLAAGGHRPPGPGFFVEPTVFAEVDNSSAIAQQEIFGPVTSVIAADNDQHAIDLANELSSSNQGRSSDAMPVKSRTNL